MAEKFWTDEQLGRIRALATEGITRDQAADRLGITRSAFRNACVTYGIQWPRYYGSAKTAVEAPPSRVLPRRTRWTEERLSELRRMAAEGMTMAQAGAAMHLARHTIKTVAGDHGISFHGKRGLKPRQKRPASVNGPAAAHLASVPDPKREKASKEAAQQRRAEMAPVAAVGEQSATPAHLRSARACCGPMWRTGSRPGPNPRFCDAPRDGLRSYCQAHAAVAYQRVPVAEAA